MQRLQILRLTLIMILVSLSLATGNGAFASALPTQNDLTPDSAAIDSTVIGVASTAIDCLSAGTVNSALNSTAAVCPSTGSVELNWQGNATSARMVLSIPDPATAPQAAHTIRVNGQAAASSPACSIAQPCMPGEYFYLNVLPEAIRQGTNQIEITADGQTDNHWMAANVRLEVLGEVTPVHKQPSDMTAASDKTAATPIVVTFRNSLDSTNQQAMAQVPDNYHSNVPTPLIVYAHARGGAMEQGTDYLGAAANSKGWLLISPQLHGSWPIPSACKIVPNNCDYDDQVLAGTTPGGGPARPGAWAHASRESQYDVIGAAKYMIEHYNVKPDQIYLVGGSMGGQTIGVTAAKFPHLFAAAYAYMGISNLGQWYWELSSSFDRTTLQKECHIGGNPKSPTENAFCYQRRSSTEFARNFVNTPISLTHSVFDELVPISHSRNLRNAINSFNPVHPVELYEERPSLWRCDPPHHCLQPNPSAVLRYLDGYRLERNPSRISIAADESKLFYWMNLDQISGDRWSYIDVTRDLDSPTVVVTTTDTSPLNIGLNLGTGWRMGEVISQPGMGLPATTYLLKGAGYFKLVDYTSGYLNTRVNTTGLSTFTLSALDVDVTADPAEVADDAPHSSAITIQVRDSSDQANPVPNGTQIQLRTTQGVFSNGQKTLTLTAVNGRATTSLTVTPSDDLAEITATVQQATGTATVNVVRPAIGLKLTPANQTAYAGVPFTMSYRVTNEGDGTLSSIAITSDNGAGGQVTICEGRTLTPGASTVCQRQITLQQSATIHAQVSGQDPTGGVITDDDSVSLAVIAPNLGLSSSPNPLILLEGESGSLTYKVTNTGDTVLTSVKIQDDDGGGGSMTACSGITLQPGATKTCPRPIQLTQSGTVAGTSIGNTITLIATATGTDPLDNEISVQTRTTVAVGGYVFLPYVVNRR